MSDSHHVYRRFNIEVSSTKAAFGGLWTGHYKISKFGHGMAAASLGGPHMSQEDAIKNALLTAKAFVDCLVG